MSSLSIYEIPDWMHHQNYDANEIYIYNNLYYYAKVKHNSGIIFDSNLSDGIITFNNQTKPYFFWIPAYNSNAPIRPSINKVQFGDGYFQSSPFGINNILLSFDLIFDKRSNMESKAIIHFLTARKGYESFVFTPPHPFNIDKLFKCEQFNHSQVFNDNNTITATFIETPL